jgi:hypothetical protein
MAMSSDSQSKVSNREEGQNEKGKKSYRTLRKSQGFQKISILVNWGI